MGRRRGSERLPEHVGAPFCHHRTDNIGRFVAFFASSVCAPHAADLAQHCRSVSIMATIHASCRVASAFRHPCTRALIDDDFGPVKQLMAAMKSHLLLLEQEQRDTERHRVRQRKITHKNEFEVVGVMNK